jgi:hypothetical protein
MWALQTVHRRLEGGAEDEQGASSSSRVSEARAAAVGDSSPPAPLASVHPPSEGEPLAQESPPKPHPKQARPDEKGQCPGRKQVALNGACWVEYPSMTAKECAENGLAYYKGRCYGPTLPPPEKPLPTSGPANPR